MIFPLPSSETNVDEHRASDDDCEELLISLDRRNVVTESMLNFAT